MSEIADLRAVIAARPRASELAQMRLNADERGKAFGLPADVTAQPTEANGVRAEWTSTPDADPAHVVLYLHGGGYVLGSLDSHRHLAAEIGRTCGARTLAVEYRLAPEHPFPAAFNDASAAWQWARAQGAGPWLIGGDSAGANLAAALAVDGSAKLQVLLYPAVDMLHQDGLYPSVTIFYDGYLLTAEGMRECARLLIPPEQDPADPRLSPIRAELSGASPALIMTAGFDPLRDQGRAFAAALQKAGVNAHLLEETTLPHGFADFAGVVPAARKAIDRLAKAVTVELERR